MKTALITATLAGIAGAAAILMLRKRYRKEAEMSPAYNPNDHHRNALGNFMHKLKGNGSMSRNRQSEV